MTDPQGEFSCLSKNGLDYSLFQSKNEPEGGVWTVVEEAPFRFGF
jgi:hypothetical protein